MRTRVNKETTTIRLLPEVMDLLKRMSQVSRESASQITEKALVEYAKNHGYSLTRYVMTANYSCYVLLRHQGEKVEVLDQQIRNGIPLTEIQATYSRRFDAPIELILDEGVANE